MSFRFFKRISIGGGSTLNLSKGGMSMSVGGRGAKITSGTSGTRMTAGLTGSGMFWTEKIGGNKRKYQSTDYGLPNNTNPDIEDILDREADIIAESPIGFLFVLPEIVNEIENAIKILGVILGVLLVIGLIVQFIVPITIITGIMWFIYWLVMKLGKQNKTDRIKNIKVKKIMNFVNSCE